MNDLLEITSIEGSAYGLDFDDLTHEESNAFITQVCRGHADELIKQGCEVYENEHHHDTCGVEGCFNDPVGIVYLSDSE